MAAKDMRKTIHQAVSKTILLLFVIMSLLVSPLATLPTKADPPVDTTKPVVGSLVFSANPWSLNQAPATLTITPSDDASGVVAAEYYIGDFDPGVGLSVPMTPLGVDSFYIMFSGEYPPGVYPIHIRVQDGAGNWSDAAFDYWVAYDANAPTVTGKKTIVPSLAAGDILPGLISSGQADKAKFDFKVKYNNQGAIASTSDFTLAYKTGTHCSNPANAVNCHSLSLNATNFAWLVVDDNNASRGIFQGTAAVEVDGVTTNNLFRVTVIDGTRLDPTSDDHIQLNVYAPGANAASAPIYQVTQPIVRGNIRVHLP